MKKSSKIYISILTFNSSKVIIPLLDSIKNQTNKNFETYIFDNNSRDNIEEISKSYKNINFVKFLDNTGYSGGNNKAFNYLKSEIKDDFKYFLIVNPDSVLDLSLIEKFQNFIALKQDFILSSPLIKYSNEYFSSGNFLGATFSNTNKKCELEEVYEKVKWNSGCCLLINVKKIKNQQLFNDYFLYYEDIQLSCKTALNYNENYCIHSTYVNHNDDSKPYPYKVYYCELNRYKFLVDTFNQNFLLIYFPIYFFLRFLIFLNIIRIYGLKYPFKEYLKGNFEGLKYFFNNLFKKEKKVGFMKTVKFLFTSLPQN